MAVTEITALPPDKIGDGAGTAVMTGWLTVVTNAASLLDRPWAPETRTQYDVSAASGGVV